MPSRSPTLLIAVSIAAVTFGLFSPLLHARFTAWDDPDTLDRNPRLHPPTVSNLIDYWTTAGESAPMGLYVPVTYTVWSIASVPAGPTAARIHAINIALHSATAALVFLLLRRFTTNIPALIGSALFALHPVQVEAVGWASGTKDLLCGLFSVLVLLIETQPARSRRWRTIAFGCFILAMLSKPTAMVVPAMLVAFDVWGGSGIRGPGNLPVLTLARRSLLKRLPWLIGSVACMICTAASQPVPWQPTLPLWTRPVVAADAIAFYLGKLVWPVKLCVDYGRRPTELFRSPAVWWTWIVPTAIAAILARPGGTPRRQLLRLAAAWFLLPLLPVLGLVPFDFQYFSTVADHYLYLPMVGVALVTAVLLPARPPAWVIAASAVVLAFVSVLTVRQQSAWMNTQSLAGRMIAVNPRTFAGHDLLGYEDFVAARQAAAAGRATSDAGYFSAAIDQYQQALANNPVYVPSLTNLAEAQRQSGRSQPALQTLHRLVALQPSLPPRLRADPRLVGRKLIDYGDPDGAVRWLQNLLRQNPSDGTARIFLSEAIRRANVSTSNPTTNPSGWR